MAKMTNALLAFVPLEKIREYLTNPDHEQGWPKGKFLKAHGFDLADHEAMRLAFLAHGGAHDAIVSPTAYGVKFEVDGPLPTPSGGFVLVRTVWIVDANEIAPRFVTLRPL